jgi:ribonuclease E
VEKKEAVTPTAPAVATSEAAVPTTAMPTVTAYELAVTQLAAVAQGAGLEWIQSDAAKIAQVQAAIAAEPKPVHVPRVAKPVAALDDGPLVLVETKRDLRNMALPFETQ